jgi:hypothetical protein
MAQFQVGDTVRGNKESDSHYTYTNSKALMEVLKVYGDGDIQVKIIESPHDVGGTFTVHSIYFELTIKPDL